MRMKARFAILGLLGLVCVAQGQTSPYAAMAVPGPHNDWNTAGSMTLVANNTWVGTQTLAGASGNFKFAANNGWTTNWGGNASLARVPAVASAIAAGNNLAYDGFTPGDYRFTFNDSTLEFRVEWAGGAPLPPPSVTNLALVGAFNNWSPTANSVMTNHVDNTNVWSLSIDLYQETAFQFYLNDSWDNQFGAPVPTTVTVPGLNIPVTNSACGKSDFTLSGFAPGTFFFALDASNATFTVTQTATQEYSIAGMTVQGSFIGTNTPPPNMMPIDNTTLWESTHYITNSSSVTLRFGSNSGLLTWGTTNGAPAISLPASGTLSTGSTAYVQLSGITPGRYRITFDHQTGGFTFRQVYANSAGLNLLLNPGFEETTEPNGGDAVGWGGWQAWPKSVASGFGPHSGNWCGAIHGQLYPEWTDFGSYAQDVLVTPGKPYQASAWLRATPGWTADSMQVKIEWLDINSNSLGYEAIQNISSLTTDWTWHSVEGMAPDGAVLAHVVYRCSGAGSSGHMLVDDAEFRSISSRTQNFDTWGALTFFDDFSPDWSISSGKTIWNVPPGRPPAGVFISQYVEGTGNNKAIEIFNGTLDTIDLAAENYILQQYNNGSTSASTSLFLTGTIPAGGSLVVARPSSPGSFTNYAPSLTISSLPNLATNKGLTFNGDDVIVLKKGTPFSPPLDRVGQVGANATGSIWSRNTTDRTLTRKATVWTGNLATVTSPFSLDEWEVSGKDDFSGLGLHNIAYIDPNEPYTPGGHSLIMNTGAMLLSGELSGGIGDVSFWWRTESMSPPLTFSIATGPSEAGPWTTNALLEDVASSNFAYYVTAVNRSDHSWVKFQQTDGGTNRFRIDEITVSAAASIPRLQDFSAWTDPAFQLTGSYFKNGWSLQNASIAPTSGVTASRAALLPPVNGALYSPAFEGGIGEIRFWAKTWESGEASRLLLETSVDGGSNWTMHQAFTISTAQTHTIWLYITNSPAQARLVFDPSFSEPGEVLVDNVEVRIPELYRNQNFDGWPIKDKYTNGVHFHQGWTITNCMVNTENAYVGQAAHLDKNTGNYILSPEFPGGIGPISFRTRKWAAGDSAFTLQIQLSPDATNWSTLTSVSATSTNYQQFTYYLYDTTNRYVRFYHSSGSVLVLVDDIRIGALTPRPEVLVTPGLAPSAPLIEEPTTLIADVITRYGASILSVTGYYKVGPFGANVPVEMVPNGGSYQAVNDIPPLPAGYMIRYWATVQYAGIGAAPGSTGYTTNSTTTATFTNYVATVEPGSVWINEIFYSPYGDEWFDGYNHEFIELCGRDGIDISGWTIELAFGRDADIAANGGNPVYASYVIPTNTAFTNMTNGFSFYVLGDAELLTNTPPPVVDQFLTVIVPTNVAPYSDWEKNHIHDVLGVVRLLNQYGHPVYSLSYGGFAPSSDRIPQTQLPFGETNSISLIGSNYTYSGFTWGMGELTVGLINDGQILTEPPAGTSTYAYAWHHQALEITPLNTNDVPPFFMLAPYPPAHLDTISVYYGYSNASYTLPDGVLYHRVSGSGGAWALLNMNIRIGSLDSNGHAYVRAEIPPHTYNRLQTLEYIIQVNANESGIETVYLGSDVGDGNLSTVYTNYDEAVDHPFTYLVPISDRIYITNFFNTATSWVFQTDGNDPVDPIVTFSIQTSTNLMTPTHMWNATNFSRSTNIYGQSMFHVPQNAADRPNLFFRIDPQWP